MYRLLSAKWVEVRKLKHNSALLLFPALQASGHMLPQGPLSALDPMTAMRRTPQVFVARP